jgi:hypothetical protein
MQDLSSGQPGQVLSTDIAGRLSWINVGGGFGTVTSVDFGVPKDCILSIEGRAITTAGRFELKINGENGGIPYFSSSSNLSSGQSLNKNELIIGGPPRSLGSLGTSHSVLHGNESGIPSFGPVVLSSEVEGILAVKNGGTGETTPEAVFNLITPTEFCGDIIYRNALRDVRLGIGFKDQILASNGTNPYWSTPRNWLTGGNSGTSGNFIGTTDSEDFVIKANSKESIRAYSNGGVSINGDLTAGSISVKDIETPSIKFTGSLDINSTDSAIRSVESNLAIYTGKDSLIERLKITQGGVVSVCGLKTNGVVHTNSSGDLSTGLVNLSLEVSEVLAVGNGGTGNGELPVVPGGIVFTDSKKFQNTGGGLSGEVLISNGIAAPFWGTELIGVSDNSNAHSGYKGEYVSSFGNKISAATAMNYFDVASIMLTPGDWDVSFVVQCFSNDAKIVEFLVGIGTGANFSGSGLILGDNAINFTNTAFQGDRGVCLPAYRISINTETTYYLKGFFIYTLAVPQMTGKIAARRIR